MTAGSWKPELNILWGFSTALWFKNMWVTCRVIPVRRATWKDWGRLPITSRSLQGRHQWKTVQNNEMLFYCVLSAVPGLLDGGASLIICSAAFLSPCDQPPPDLERRTWRYLQLKNLLMTLHRQCVQMSRHWMYNVSYLFQLQSLADCLQFCVSIDVTANIRQRSLFFCLCFVNWKVWRGRTRTTRPWGSQLSWSGSWQGASTICKKASKRSNCFSSARIAAPLGQYY